jgi:hypothetical protein
MEKKQTCLSSLRKRISGLLNRFLLPWTAYFGLLISTSTCPCCGQPACPTGVAGMGILASLFAAVTGLFKRRRVPTSGPEKA